MSGLLVNIHRAELREVLLEDVPAKATLQKRMEGPG